MTHTIYLDINLPQHMSGALVCRLRLGRWVSHDTAEIDIAHLKEKGIPKLGKKVLKAVEKDLGMSLPYKLTLENES